MKLWDLRNERCTSTFKGHTSGITSVAFHPNANYIVSGARSNVLKVWDVRRTDEHVFTVQGHLDSINAVNFSPKGEYLCSASDDATVHVYRSNIEDKGFEYIDDFKDTHLF